MVEFEDLFKEKGYKMTEQRHIVLDVLMENKGEHMSTKKIWDIARKKDSTIGMATVYRTINIMDELGIITGLSKKDEHNKYELSAGEEEHIHSHLVCPVCGRVVGISPNIIDGNINDKIKKLYNVEAQDIWIKCYAICEECTKKSNEKAAV